MKVAIVGGGVAGLAIGWRLAEAGVGVELFERGICGRAASWAAAGMLAATAESGAADDPHAKLAREARNLWPHFARALEQASRTDIAFTLSGALIVARNDAHARELILMANTLGARGENVRFLSRDEARQMEPCLTPEFNGALFSGDDAHVDNRALGVALAIAFQNAGGVLHENCAVRALHVEQNGVRAVITADGAFPVDCIIVAAGAWTHLIAGVAPETLPPVKPSKGQMTSLAPPDGTALPRHLIWGSDIYVTPRRDRLLIGATVEDNGFDTSVNQAARNALIEAAVRLIPDLANWRVAESWSGLRPHTPDEMPVLGATSVSGLFVASGQYRNGILFAPAVAEIMRDLVLGREAMPLARAFDPKRFLSVTP